MSRTILCYAEIFDVIFGGQKKSRHFRPARKNYLFFAIATTQCIRWVTGHTNYLGFIYAQPDRDSVAYLVFILGELESFLCLRKTAPTFRVADEQRLRIS